MLGVDITDNTFSSASFFLGATGKHGYVSLFNDVYSPEKPGAHYILKGGPGTGKSTLMKKAAKHLTDKGYFVEKDYCSADPSSLDMIYCPELNFSVTDGTSPHIFEPSLPGVTEFIVNLGEAWNKDILKENIKEINSLFKAYSAEHKKAANYLFAASKCSREAAQMFLKTVDYEKSLKYIKKLCTKKIPDKNSAEKGKINKRFLSGITPDGVAVQYDTLNVFCDEIVTFCDEYGVLSQFFIDYIGEFAVNKGYDIYKCFCPLYPETKAEHIIIPELKLCFFTENEYHYSLDDIKSPVFSTRFCDKKSLFGMNEKARFLFKCKHEFIDESVRKMSAAKGLHDKLEEFYIKATDFSVIDGKCEEILKSV